MSISYEELIALYLYCTRDHNTGFHPAWEYFAKSEMQKRWYEFEYLHKHFLKKAAAETGGAIIRMGSGAAFGAAAGAIGGPAGAGAGALAGVASASMRTLISDMLVKPSLAKGKRQWALHKGRQAVQEKHHANLSLLSTQRDLFLALTCKGTYYWPGYEKFRLPLDLWKAAVPDGTFKRLKRRLFFKPPKSGERLNVCDFSYSGMLLYWDEDSRRQFDRIWQASRFWPMLDYLFFNQSLYAELQNWKSGGQSLKSFLFAARYYFLSRDFYLDHFFSHVLPKYEIILSRRNNTGTHGGGIAGFNVLGHFFEIVRGKIGKEAARKNILGKMGMIYQISGDILQSCAAHLGDLSPELKIEGQRFIQEIFLEYCDSEVSPHSASESSSLQALKSRLSEALVQNESEFDAVVNDDSLSARQKKDRLRYIQTKHRRILMGGDASSTYFLHDSVSFGAALQFIGSPSALELLTVPVFFGLEGKLTNTLPNFDIVSEPTVDGVMGGIEICSEILGAYLEDACTAHLPAKHRARLARFSQICGGIRLVGGMADFICRVSTDNTLAISLLGTGIGGAVAESFLVEEYLLSILIAYALQRGKNFLYYRMDQICLSAVDQLVVMDHTRGAAPYVRPGSAGTRSSTSTEGTLASGPVEPFRLPIIIKVVNAQHYAADAQIFSNSGAAFQDSTLLLPGVILHQSEDTDLYGPPSVHIRYRNIFVVNPQIRSQIRFHGAGALQGLNILKYAAKASCFYAQLAYDWGQKTIDYEPQLAGHVGHAFFQVLAANAKTKPVNHILHLAVGDRPNEHIVTIDQCIAITQSWHQATQAAFELLKLENSIKMYSKAKADPFRYTETQQIYDTLLNFIDVIKADKNIFNDLPEWHEEERQHLPYFIQTQNVFMRVLYLAGVSLFRDWLTNFEKNLPKVKDFNSQADLGQPTGLEQATQMSLLLERIQPEYFRADVRHSQPGFLIQTADPACMHLQQSQFGYDALNDVGNLHFFTLQLKKDLERYYRMMTPQTSPSSARPAFRDFSDLGLGLKFTKDPNTFTAAEKEVLYKHFGRVVRHLFNAAPLPGEIDILQNQLEDLLLEIQKPEVSLKPKHITDFMDAYFKFTHAVMNCNVFIYYMRVYQFLQETVRLDFLNSTAQLRREIMKVTPPETHNGRYDELDEIKLLCEQLNCE